MSSQPPIYFVTRVTRWASSNLGDAIQLETIVKDESRIILRSAYKDIARLTQAIFSAAHLAQQKQRAIPNQNLELMSPWVATSMRSTLSIGGQYVGLVYRTTEGVPIQLAMSPELARETIARLSSELARITKGQTPRLS